MIARFKSVDPLTKEYPWYTPYQFAGNKPIWAIDLDGMEELISNQVDIREDLSMEDSESIKQALYIPVFLKVAEPRPEEESFQGRVQILFTTLGPINRKYYFDDLAQTDSDYGLGGLLTEGGEEYFDINSRGEIDINDGREEPQQASLIRIGQLARTSRGVIQLTRLAGQTRTLVHIVYGTNIIKNENLRKMMTTYVRKEASLGNGGSADVLKYEATTGSMDFSPSGHIQKVAEARGKLFEILRNEQLTSAERKLVIKELKNIQEALRITFGKGSKYPYNEAAKQAINVLNKQQDF